MVRKMKIRYVFTALAIVLAGGLMAQNAKVVSAYTALQEATKFAYTNNFVDAAKNLTKAIEYIEPAITHEKTALKEKTWRYRGDIYALIAQFSEKSEIRGVTTDAISKGVESYLKARELDTKGAYDKETSQGLENLRGMSINEGIGYFNSENFDKAYNSFNLANEIGAKFNVIDSSNVFNAGLAAERAEMFDEAIANYRKCIEMDYNGSQMFSILAEVYKGMGKAEEAQKVIDEGLAKYPDDQALITDKVNSQLGADDLGGAEGNLLKMIEAQPDNANLRFALGSVYDTKGEKEKAEEYYQKAVDLDPEYFDAVYNLGALYFNKAVEMNTSCNDIPPSQISKYNKCMADTNKMFDKSLPHLEKARELKSDDPNTLQSLMQLYARKGETEKYDEIKAMLGM